jgi:hypothetical protein
MIHVTRETRLRSHKTQRRQGDDNSNNSEKAKSLDLALLFYALQMLIIKGRDYKYPTSASFLLPALFLGRPGTAGFSKLKEFEVSFPPLKNNKKSFVE